MESPLEKEEEETEEVEETQDVEEVETPEGDTSADDQPETIESWMEEEDETERTGSDTVPLHALVKAKKKYRGKIESQNSEIERLKAENAALKAVKPADKLEIPPRPKRNDFDDDDLYEAALDKWLDDKETVKFNQLQQNHNITISQSKAIEQQQKALSEHDARVDKLITEHGISEDVYMAADQNIRDAIEGIRPGQGDMITDEIIAILGPGSEKVVFKIGNPKNKALRGELIETLVSDPRGLKLSAFLGEQKALLSNITKRKKSGAPPPPTKPDGDGPQGDKSKLFKRQYDEAHKKGDSETAWKVRKQAKAAKIDVSGW